ncbi:MAG TPA: thymidine phosphorylase [Acidimicrobiales bacterium]|nr:thymidine phosphorylase [Acidimicrobiales bacterium]
MSISAVELVRAKRDGAELDASQITWLVDAYTNGRVPDEQMSAFLMAVYFRGMSRQETSALTRAMVASGEVMDLSGVGRPSVDKHSTGGVGDKVSLIVVPLLASMGAAVPQLSGRGLGHTGGTLDKMEAIPGWRAQLSPETMVEQLKSVGGAICAAGETLAPADRKLYALRDVTATVEAIPLIAASIMSKKIAEGTESLVLDVKVGNGAFMKDRQRAGELARAMVEIGTANGMRVVALLTTMEAPLGRAAGNAVEVAEALEVLTGGGPADLVEVTLALARTMADLAGLDADQAGALRDGSALESWKGIVRAQGGDPDAALPVAPVVDVFVAPETGYVQRLDALAVGVAAWRLGAGRERKEDPVSPCAGVICCAKPGEQVRAGDPLFELHTGDPGRLSAGRQALHAALSAGKIRIDPEPPPPAGPLIIERVG